jgi:HK97 gp10 family phage protein
MATTTITISGLSELSDLLKNVAPKVAKSYLVYASKPARNVVISAFQESAPVFNAVLRDSITYQNKWETGEDGGTALVTRIGPNKHVPWGSWEEYGTSHQPATHWLTNAWNDCKDEVLSTYVSSIQDLFDRMLTRNEAEEAIDNPGDDTGTHSPRTTRLRRDRNRADMENNERNRVSLMQHSSGMDKSENDAYKESK